MNSKILGAALVLLAIAMCASPVMAIGPQNAEKNPHIVGDPDSGLTFMTGASGNTFMWFNNPESNYYGMVYHDADVVIGDGRYNNAVHMDWITFLDTTGNPDYYNKWLYFSNEPIQALGGHSILWALGQFAMGGQGDLLVTNHPNGIYAMWHFVK